MAPELEHILAECSKLQAGKLSEFEKPKMQNRASSLTQLITWELNVHSVALSSKALRLSLVRKVML